MHTFEHQETSRTLAQGLAEYYSRNPDLARGAQLSPDAQEFFRCHDAAYVVFGCVTSLPDEAVVKLSSLFGATAGFSVLRGYRLHESVDIYRRLRPRDILRTIVVAIGVVPRTVFRCLRQTRRWPWADFAAHLDTPLGKLRAEHGIRVADFGKNRSRR